MMLTHCGNNVRNRYSGCVFSVKDIVPVPLKTSRNLEKVGIGIICKIKFSSFASFPYCAGACKKSFRVKRRRWSKRCGGIG